MKQFHEYDKDYREHLLEQQSLYDQQACRYELVHSNQPMGHMGGECSELKEQWERMYANHLMLHVQSLKELKEALITSWIQEAGLAV
jgi:hypothetical protein